MDTDPDTFLHLSFISNSAGHFSSNLESVSTPKAPLSTSESASVISLNAPPSK